MTELNLTNSIEEGTFGLATIKLFPVFRHLPSLLVIDSPPCIMQVKVTRAISEFCCKVFVCVVMLVVVL